MSLPRARHLVLLLLLACVSIAGALISGCGAADKVSAAADPVEEAVAATTKAEGARVEMRMAFEGLGTPGAAAITAQGVADLRGDEAQMTIDLGPLAALAAGAGAPDAADLTMELRLVDGTMYLRSGLLTGELPAGKTWIGVDVAELGKQLGIDASQFSQLSDPTQVLEYLRDAGDVRKVGRAEIRGVATTRYRAQIKLDEALDALGGGAKESEAMREALKGLLPENGIPADVWIGDDDLLRRMELKLTAGAATTGAMPAGFGMSIRLDLFDYGTKVSVEAPPASQVADGSKLLSPGATP